MSALPTKDTTPKGWTDAEKIALLVHMVDTRGGPNWNAMTLPPDRTKRACDSVWTRMRAEARKTEWYDAKGTGKEGTKCKVEDEEGEGPSEKKGRKGKEGVDRDEDKGVKDVKLEKET